MVLVKAEKRQDEVKSTRKRVEADTGKTHDTSKGKKFALNFTNYLHTPTTFTCHELVVEPVK
jgi:hypothetical protein